MRRTSAASRSTTSTWRASRSHAAANSTASGRGSIVRRSTSWPSALETIFWVTTRTSPDCGASSGSAAARSRQRVRDQPGEVGAGLDLRQRRQRDGERRPTLASAVRRLRDPAASSSSSDAGVDALEVLGRVEVEAEGRIDDQLDAGVGGARRADVGLEAGRPERRLDDGRAATAAARSCRCARPTARRRRAAGHDRQRARRRRRRAGGRARPRSPAAGRRAGSGWRWRDAPRPRRGRRRGPR